METIRVNARHRAPPPSPGLETLKNVFLLRPRILGKHEAEADDDVIRG